jgi:uncharacterized membrane protein YhaH (DUF805 family)
MNLALPFRYSGRIGRRDYWIGFAIVLVVAGGLAAAFAPYFSTTGGTGMDRAKTFAAFALFLWVHSAVTVKRLHDLNRPAWHYLFYGLLPIFLIMLLTYPTLSFIGMALWAWTKYHLGFKRGTVGPNDYGPDPLEPAAPDSFEPA